MTKSATNPISLPLAVGAGALALALLAIVNKELARKAERENPPVGQFVEVDGVRLHYVDRGEGEPVVLLHGANSMVQDMLLSGLVDSLAGSHRVIAFDRPGYGHSERPRTTIWTANAQADLISAALGKIGVPRAIVLGHSWGASVATALALNHPGTVRGLVLASGYYYPGLRADVVPMSMPAVPGLGDIMRFTVSPLLARAMWPAVLRGMFGPSPVPAKFAAFPKEMAVRPSQVRASAAEGALLIPAALAAHERYGELRMPVAIVAGDADRIIDFDDQSARLHGEIAQSTLHRVSGVGHMVHQSATPQVLAAIKEVAGKARSTFPATTTSLAA